MQSPMSDVGGAMEWREDLVASPTAEGSSVGNSGEGVVGSDDGTLRAEADYITRECAAYPGLLNKAVAEVLAWKPKQQGEETQNEAGPENEVIYDMPDVTKALPMRGREKPKTEDQVQNSLRDVHQWVAPRNLIARSFDRNPESEKEILASLGHKTTSFRQAGCKNWGKKSQICWGGIGNQTWKEKWCVMLWKKGPTRHASEGESGARSGWEVHQMHLWGSTSRIGSRHLGLGRCFPQNWNRRAIGSLQTVDRWLSDLPKLWRRWGRRRGIENFGRVQRAWIPTEVWQRQSGESRSPRWTCVVKVGLHQKGEDQRPGWAHSQVANHPGLQEVLCVQGCKESTQGGTTCNWRHPQHPEGDGQGPWQCQSSHCGRDRCLLADTTETVWKEILRGITERSPLHLQSRSSGLQSSTVVVRCNHLSSGTLGCVCQLWLEASGLCGWPHCCAAWLSCGAKEDGLHHHSDVGHHALPHCDPQSHAVGIGGIRLQVNPTGVSAEVPEEKAKELDAMLAEMMRANMVSKKTLRTVIGKAMAIASVLFVWRPFIAELYTALHMEQTKAPDGCVWTKQIVHSIRWLRTFLAGEQAGITRHYSLDVFRSSGPEVVITWDASPFGMGGTLQVGGQSILSTRAGSHEGQQTWEALCGLISLRLWLKLRNDNMGALTLFAQVKGKSASHVLLAREFALDLGKAQYRPSVAEHIPGISNTICDALSRRHQAGFEHITPIQLKHAKEVAPPPRPKEWWKTLSWTARSPTASNAEKRGDRLLVDANLRKKPKTRWTSRLWLNDLLLSDHG